MRIKIKKQLIDLPKPSMKLNKNHNKNIQFCYTSV